MTENPMSSLQFEHAEVATDSCSACGQPLASFYYTVGGQIVCERCKADVEQGQANRPGVGGVMRAIAWGSLAGVLGAFVWWGVRTWMSLEIGLIAIGIGHFVGKGVRRGSNGLGGRGYQVLAVLLTYFWIAANYAPDIVQGFFASANVNQSDVAAAPATAPSPSGTPDPSPASTAGGAVAAEPAMHPLAALAAFLAIVIGISLAAPFLQGIENVIGLLIIGFGLFETWRLNRKPDLSISGPFAVTRPVPPPPPSVD